MSAIPWAFFPDYRASNPYQALLAAALAPGAAAMPGRIDQVLDQQIVRPGRGVFHLHWEDAIYRDAPTEAEACTEGAVFLAELAAFRAGGGQVVWTVHNAAPHEARYSQAGAALRAELAHAVDVIHLHGPSAAALLAKGGAQTKPQILVFPHPNYIGAYPDDVSRAAARRYFALPEEALVFAFLGNMRGYKGLDMLRLAFAELRRTIPAARLILAGRAAQTSDARYLLPEPGICLVPRFIEDTTVQYVLRAADFVVLPYRRVLTSGAMMLALGFGCPVIVPDLPGLVDVVAPGREALMFRPEDAADLARALRQGAALAMADRQAMAEAALATARAVGFDGLAQALMNALTVAAATEISIPR